MDKSGIFNEIIRCLVANNTFYFILENEMYMYVYIYIDGETIMGNIIMAS